MKKVYTKPGILFEDFQMNTNIAGNCNHIINTSAKGTCAYTSTGGIAVFSDTVSKCDFTPTDMGSKEDDIWDGFCYHVPTDYNDLFNS